MKRATLVAIAAIAWTPSYADMRIHILDAGQADASLIQIDQPGGDPVSIVVDGGNHDSDIRDHLPNVLNGDTTIELAVLTHPHEDHIGGMDFLVERAGLTVEHVWSNLEEHDSDAYRFYEGALDRTGVVETRPEEAEYLILGTQDFSLRVFNNGGEFPDTGGDNINNDSLVFQVIYEPADGVRVTALFTRDIEDATGENLVNEFGAELQSDIVKVPHHGSGDHFGPLAATIDAQVAFVSSSGTHSGHEHPRQATLDLYDARGDVFCTCITGTGFHSITATVDTAGNITVAPDQEQYFVWAPDGNGGLHQIVVTP